MNDRSLLDIALEYVSVALILAGAAPAIIAAVILTPILIRAVAGWEGVALTALLLGVLFAPPSRLRLRRRRTEPSAPAAEPTAG